MIFELAKNLKLATFSLSTDDVPRQQPAASRPAAVFASYLGVLFGVFSRSCFMNTWALGSIPFPFALV